MIRRTTGSFTMLVLPLALVACGQGGGRSSGGASTAAIASGATPSATGASTTSSSTSTTTTAATTPAAPAALPALDVVPLILIHGHGGDPANWNVLVDKIAQGRAVLKDVYAKDAEALAPNSVSPGVIVEAGYYRDERSGVKFDLVNGVGTGSIGSCPVPRTDGAAGLYPISYAERIHRIVEGVRRATGSARVDLALHSMGNDVGRAYTKWLSIDPTTQKSVVRRILMVAGPNRGINALEATIDGLDHAGDRTFMRQGEECEMCGEYKGWSGTSFIDQLNDNWDGFCQANGIEYAGITATGAFGKQVAPPPPPGSPPPSPPISILGFKLSGPLDSIARAILALGPTSFPEVWPLIKIWAPRLITEVQEALSASDGTVRVAIARMDQAPFLGHKAHVMFEARHGDDWNTEQSAHNSRLTAQLVRTFCVEGKPPMGRTILKTDVRNVDATGHASWVEVEVQGSGDPALSWQLVEEKLDASGNPVGGAQGFGGALTGGDETFLVPVDAGGGTRRYHLVIYGSEGGPVTSTDTTLALVDGPLVEKAPTATLDGTASGSASAPKAKLVATSDAPATEPTLRYSWRIDRGAWTPFTTDATIETPALAAGIHEAEVRALHAHNAAAVAVETAAPTRVAIVVDAQGGVSFVR